MSDNKMVFANRLSCLLQSKRCTQKELAEYMQVSNPTIYDWKKGNILPRMDKIERLATFFEVSTDYLLGKTDGKKSNTSMPSSETSNKLLDLICGDDVELRKDLASIDTHGSFLNKDGSTAELSENAISTLRYVIKSAVEQAKVTGDKHIRIKSHNKGG